MTNVHEQTAEMVAVADRTIEATFGWKRADHRLYEEVPTAFWLAPGAQEEVYAPENGILRASTRPTTVTRPPTGVVGMGAAMGFAMLAAGPIFTATALVPLFDKSATIGMVMALTLLLPVTALVGSVLGALPIATGTAALCTLGKRNDVAREGGIWAATGGGMGLAIAGLLDAGIVSTALVLTSIACALIAHRSVAWIDTED